MDMATAPEKVKLEDIDLVLRDAQICNAQLDFLHHRLNEPDVDEERSAEIESKCATIFRYMMINLYTVLDQIYYFLHFHYRTDNGDVSSKHSVWQIKQPKEVLKWSDDDTVDKECEKKRNKWVTDECEKIFGGNCSEGESYVRMFQDNLLRLQAIRKVDKSGKEELRGNLPLRVDCESDSDFNKKLDGWVSDECKKIFDDNCPEGEPYVREFLEKLPRLRALSQKKKKEKSIQVECFELTVDRTMNRSGQSGLKINARRYLAIFVKIAGLIMSQCSRKICCDFKP